MNIFLLFIVIASLLLPATSRGETIILYDASAGTLPAAQGWTYAFYPFPPFGDNQAIQTFDDDGEYVRLDTCADTDDMAGFFSDSPASQPLEALPESMDPSQGYMLSFAVRIEEENHVSDDRAGFSVILTGDDYAKAIELAFWEDEIWVQEGGTSELHTHAEGVAFDTTSAMRSYDLLISDDGYILRADGEAILAGATRDYSSFSGNPLFGFPYTTPRLIFLGDDTSSAEGRFVLRSIDITLPVLANLNNDDAIGLDDAVLLFQILVGMSPGQATLGSKADVDGDGRLGMEEGAFILKKIAENQ